MFYDLQQHLLGSCEIKDIAAMVVVRVLAHFPKRNEIVIDGGWMALSEQGFDKLGGSFAYVKGHPELQVYKMTQEVGYIRSKDTNKELTFDKHPVGSVLYLYQYHSCQYASRFPTYHVHQNGIIIDEWKPANFW